MRGKQVTYWVIFCALCVGYGVLKGQVGEAGRESPFSIGVGARALGLGNAGTAFPDDPSAFAWNPAGMVVVEEKRVGLSLTTLFEGTLYNFIGFVYPTMDAGTFGFGMSRIGTGGIKYTKVEDGAPFDTGEEIDYWWGKLTLSYAATFFRGLSVGFNLNVNRQSLWLYSTNGFGVDFGIHYRIPVTGGLLNNLYFGGMVENGISPRMKLGTKAETIPYITKLGIAKYFQFRGNRDRWLFLVDWEQGQQKESQYHFGTEYSWNRSIYLRVGVDDGEFSFGGGLRYRHFQIDYGMSQIGDPEFFQRSHRFSLVFYIGKSIPEKRRILEEQRLMEIQSGINQRIEANRQEQIAEGLRSGNEYIENGDYFNARLAFSSVLRIDPDHAEARELLDWVTEKDQELQEQRQEALLQRERETVSLQRDNEFISARLKEGLEALDNRDFRKAIENFEQALERDPEDPQIQGYLQQARSALENEVYQLFARAQQNLNRGEISEAYNALDRARDQAEGNPNLQTEVQRRLRNLEINVDFINSYQAGVNRYAQGEYDEAARYFARALEYRPDDEPAKEYYQKSLARSLEERSELEGEALGKYRTGLERYREGLFKEALQLFNEALALAPNNVRLLNAIEDAEKRIELYEE
ncbi:PorV/PorQ family protein [bacterium]|nr:PorV/PorQ family protein [bacterium]RQV94313.1 MAG: PorV/PorQ family protein [bacterium]